MSAGSIVITLLMFLAYPPDTKLISHNGSVTVSKAAPKSTESVLDFTNANGDRLCTLDYSSEDSRHGHRVVKAAWTHDQRYFVWSLESSGGHQPWHFPTLAFDSKTRRILQLDDFVHGPGLTRGKFGLRGSSTVESREGKQKALFDLNELSHTPPSGNEFHCDGGITFRLDRRR